MNLEKAVKLRLSVRGETAPIRGRRFFAKAEKATLMTRNNDKKGGAAVRAMASRLALALILSVPVAGLPALVSVAQAQVVQRIVVEGNQRVEREAILAYLQLRRGTPFDPARIDASLKSLFQTGLFSDVQILRRGNTLIVRVVENPMINRVRFEGNNEVSDKDLAKEVQLHDRAMLTRARVQADVERIINIYRRSGYYNVQVEPQIIRRGNNTVDLIFKINEGKATRVATIRFVGNKAFSDGKLKDVITTSEHAWWKFFSTRDRYDPDRLAYDRELLRRFYLKHGFADVQILSANAELAPDGESFIVTFTIEEGPQYRIGNVAVDATETDLNPRKLQKLMETRPGEIYDASEVDKSVEKIALEAARQGFAFAKVRPEIERDAEARKLNITYKVQEGPRVYIERIEIVGNARTREEVIRRELRIAEGDAYNRVLLDRARRRLTALDFFQKIDFQEMPGSAPDRLVLIIKVMEKSTGSLHASIGYSTLENGPVVSGSITERNFMGTGRELSLKTSLSFKRQSLNFSYTEPYFLDYNMAAGFDLFGNRTDLEDQSDYKTNDAGFGLRANFSLDDYQTLYTRYRLTYRNTIASSDAKADDDADGIINICDTNSSKYSPSVCDSLGKDWISTLGVTYVMDRLDNPANPTSGFRLQAALDVAGLGGTVHYVRSEVAGYYFMPLFFDGLILKLKGTGGHVFAWNGDKLRVNDRFFKGGPSFRGFEVSGVGPRDAAGNAIGGQTYAIGTVELLFPLGLPEDLGLSGSVFTDFGTVFDAPESGVQDKAVFRATVGAGLLWRSPFGPLRLDLAYALKKASWDKEELVQFGVGTRF